MSDHSDRSPRSNAAGQLTSFREQYTRRRVLCLEFEASGFEVSSAPCEGRSSCGSRPRIREGCCHSASQCGRADDARDFTVFPSLKTLTERSVPGVSWCGRQEHVLPNEPVGRAVKVTSDRKIGGRNPAWEFVAQAPFHGARGRTRKRKLEGAKSRVRFQALPGNRKKLLSSSGSDQAREGRLVDALAARGDEGRDNLR